MVDAGMISSSDVDLLRVVDDPEEAIAPRDGVHSSFRGWYVLSNSVISGLINPSWLIFFDYSLRCVKEKWRLSVKIGMLPRLRKRGHNFLKEWQQ